MEERPASAQLALPGGLILVLTLASVGALEIAADRVGAHKASTFGDAYRAFEESWGGEQVYAPPDLQLVPGSGVPPVTLHPSEVRLSLDLTYAERTDGWLRFKTYEARAEDSYTVVNHTRQAGTLQLLFKRPQGASILHDFNFRVDGEASGRPITFNDWVEVVPVLEPGSAVTFHLGYRTNGVDRYRYRVSALQHRVTHLLSAVVRVDTSRFVLLHQGLPHVRQEGEDGVTLTFGMKDFSTWQDLGIVFDSDGVPLDQVERLVRFGSVALFLFLLSIFAQAYLRGFVLTPLHVIGLAIVIGFYFAFVSYLVRFFGLTGTLACAFALSGAMAASFSSAVLGRRFSLKIVAPYFAALTLGHSMIFLTPLLQGIGLLVLVFGVFASLMPRLGRASRAAAMQADLD